MRFRMFMLAVVGAAAIAAGAPPVNAQTQGEKITSTVIPLGSVMPPRDAIAKACEYVAKLPFAERRNKLRQSGRFDVNNDGIEEDVEFASMGTMRFDQFRIHTGDGRTIEIDTVGGEELDRDSMAFWPHGTAWLLFEGFTYRIVSQDNFIEKPLTMTVLQSDYSEKTVCTFSNTKTLHIFPTEPTYEAICRIAEAKRFSPLNSSGSLPETLQETAYLDKRLHSRTSTLVDHVAMIDFDNDGTQDYLVSLGSARGDCETDYYDIVDKDGRILEKTKKRALLMELQEMRQELKDPAPVYCGSSTKFLVHENKVYFQVTPKTENVYFYQLALAENETVKKICKSRYTIRTTVD